MKFNMILKKTNEIIFTTIADSKKSAVNYFSILKKMKKSDFNKIYKVNKKEY